MNDDQKRVLRSSRIQEEIDAFNRTIEANREMYRLTGSQQYLDRANHLTEKLNQHISRFTR